MSSTRIPVAGFKECDIRGEMGTAISTELAYTLGRALGTLAKEQTDSPQVVVGGDFRASTPLLLDELARGIQGSGADVIALGQLSTPGFYFARRHLGVKPGVMVTASHSPSSWNGFKIILGDYPITPAELENIKQMILAEQFATGSGQVQHVDILDTYLAWLVDRFSDLKHNAPKIVFDSGNGATGWIIQRINEQLNLDAHIMFTEPDGAFPNRSPDIAHADDLILLQREATRVGADIGIGFDGDGDRVGIVDHTGQRIPSDRLIAWLAGALLEQHSGDAVIYDLKLSKAVPETITRHGGVATPQKSGHTFIKTAMLDHNAVFGGEYSGHLFFRELEGSDDALYAALLIASLVAASGKPLSDLLADIPRYHSTPEIRIRYVGDRQALIAQTIARARAENADVLLLDGVKVSYADGWALMRASVTEAALTFRFEGDTSADARAVAERFLHGIGDVGGAVWEQVQQVM